jgi:hypothetical protein
MDQASLYETDVHAWSQRQARLLRDLARSGLSLPNELDLDHVAEEIEDLGAEQRFAVESNLRQAFLHLLKLSADPEGQSVRHWLKETRAFLRMAERRYRPSMRHLLDAQLIWAQARKEWMDDLEIDGLAPPPAPVECPFTLEELVTGEPDPRVLLARIAPQDPAA